MSKPEFTEFASSEAMAANVADLIETALARAVANNERGALAVSGGSTPKALYENLALRDLPWPNISATVVDERWVSRDHPRSNEKFIRKAFAAAEGIRINGLYTGDPSPADGAVAVGKMLDGRQKPFDAVILGMGEDGHTASWFPYATGLEDALNSERRVCPITAEKSAITGEEVMRMTLTLFAIKDAGIIVLLIAGEKKLKTLRMALGGGNIKDMPVRAVLQARPDMLVCWAP